MSIVVAMIVKDEGAVLERCLASVAPLVDAGVIVDTGSSDDTAEIAARHGFFVFHKPWRSFGENLTEARDLARAHGDWVLRLDADMTVGWHRDFPAWLDEDPDPDVVAWRVELVQKDVVWRLPLLTRATVRGEYVGATHEYLEIEGKQRNLLGLTVLHHHDGSHRTSKFERDLELLRPAFDAGDPRATYYTAETLRCLGRTDEAISAFRLRADMSKSFEEERWHAEYRAASLAGDVEALLKAHSSRPYRHEPLTAAARILAGRPSEDVLFHEPLLT